MKAIRTATVLRKGSICVLVLMAMAAVLVSDALAVTPTVSPDTALAELRAGNARYVEGKSTHPHLTADRRGQTTRDGQHPMAVVLACSDSRVPVELVLDQGIGDLFVIRVAGNVCGQDEIASIEYGVEHLGTPLVVILGHSQCGAVTAAASHAQAHGNLPRLLSRIEPAVARAQREHPDHHGSALVADAAEANVWQAAEDLLKNSEELRAAAKSGHVRVVGAFYDIEKGTVRFLGKQGENAK